MVQGLHAPGPAKDPSYIGDRGFWCPEEEFNQYIKAMGATVDKGERVSPPPQNIPPDVTRLDSAVSDGTLSVSDWTCSFKPRLRSRTDKVPSETAILQSEHYSLRV